MAQTLICTHSYRAFGADWRSGQLVAVSDQDAARLLGFQVQVASAVFGIFRPATAEEIAGAAATPDAWTAPVAQRNAPPVAELEGLHLEALRTLGVGFGIAGAHGMTQAELLAAFAAVGAPAPSSTSVTPLPLTAAAAPATDAPTSSTTTTETNPATAAGDEPAAAPPVTTANESGAGAPDVTGGEG